MLTELNKYKHDYINGLKRGFEIWHNAILNKLLDRKYYPPRRSIPTINSFLDERGGTSMTKEELHTALDDYDRMIDEYNATRDKQTTVYIAGIQTATWIPAIISIISFSIAFFIIL